MGNRNKRILIFLLIFTILLPSLPIFRSTSAQAALNLPLTITDYTGMSRINEPVTSGVPLPESANITSINQLQLTDAQGNDVPAQFTVLSRWKGTPSDTTKPIKWVLIDLQANVSASGSALYYLKDGGVGNASDTNFTISQDSNKIIISTGKAKFQVNKNYFNLFDYAWIDKDNDGQLNDLIISQPNAAGVVLTDQNGKQFTALLEAPEEIEFEEQGPMRATLKIRGVLRAQDGSYFAPAQHHSQDYPNFDQVYANSFVYYNARIYFYNNKDYVKLFFTLENNGANGRSNPEQYSAPTQIVYFDSANLILKPNNFSQADVISADASTNLGAGDSFTIYQDWRENLVDNYKSTLEPTFENGVFYSVKKNNQELSSGRANPGWFDVNSSLQGISLAMKNFWQNFPKEISASSSEIKIGLWPEEGYYPYCRSDFSDPTYSQPPYNYSYDIYCEKAGKDAGTYLFDSGVHKTNEMFLRFYAGGQNAGQAQNLFKSLDSPLMALASPEWYAETKALGMITPAGLTSANPEINEAMQRYEKLQSAFVYENDSDNKLTILNIKTKNPPHWETLAQNRFFGWMNFGDLMWSGQIPASLHYDWTYVMLLHYLRTGKRNFFDAGSDMAKHRYDIDQYHGDKSAPGISYTKYMQAYYESSGHADPTTHAYNPSKVSLPTHTWDGGIVLYYLLTGDRRAYEAAEEVGQGMLNYFGTGGLNDADNNGCAYTETRYETWSMLNLINLYRVSGNSEYLRVAKNIAKNRLLYREQQVGGDGCLGIEESNSVTGKYDYAPCQKVGCGSCKNFQYSVMLGYLIDPLIQIHYETQDEDLKNLIVRIADFTKDKYIYGGDYDQSGKYRPLQSAPTWIEEDPDCTKRGCKGEPIRMVFFSDLFAYAYKLTNKSEYLGWARKCFRDTMFYFSWGGNFYGDPNNKVAITYINGGFPETHTKVNSWLGRTNQVYLAVERELQSGGLEIITATLPNGNFGQSYNYSLSAVGGNSPYTWQITSGNLPTGLTLNSSSGIIFGTPTQQGTFSFAVKVTDSIADSVTKNFSIIINSTPTQQDTTAPSVITNLSASNITQNSVNLSWTAPGDDGPSGTASLYDLRYATSTVTQINWNSALETNGEPVPLSAGSQQLFTVTGLLASTTYYFAVKTKDEANNWSTISNIASAKTLSPISSGGDGGGGGGGGGSGSSGSSSGSSGSGGPDSGSSAQEGVIKEIDLTKIDSDQDSLSDALERKYGTDAAKADTDGDGYNDYMEIMNKHDPLMPAPAKNKPVIIFAYNKPRLKSLIDEKNKAKLLRQELEKNYTSKQLQGISAKNWHKLVNAYIYGNYPVGAIVKSVKYGGKTVHLNIPHEQWRKSKDYLMYIKK